MMDLRSDEFSAAIKNEVSAVRAGSDGATCDVRRCRYLQVVQISPYSGDCAGTAVWTAVPVQGSHQLLLRLVPLDPEDPSLADCDVV